MAIDFSNPDFDPEELTEPLVAYYRGQGKLYEIDGSGTIEASTEETLRILEDGE